MSTPPPPAPNSHGFGSFHTERDDNKIDVLITLPPDRYKPPRLPVNIDLSSLPLPSSPSEVFSAPMVSLTPDLTQLIEKPHQYTSQITTSFGHSLLNDWFHIDPSFTFVNHGAFGATFRPVSHAEYAWHEHMESQPLRYIDRQLLPILVYTTRRLAEFVNCDTTDVVMLPNATMGLNTVLNSIQWLSPIQTPLTSIPSLTGPPQPVYVLTFDTGYGATKQMIKSIQDKFGPHVIHQDLHVSLPVSGPSEIVALLKHSLRAHVKQGTIGQIKLVIVDYIQSNSAMVYPIKELCELCRQYGIPVMIDGAHGLGVMPLNLRELGATFYVSNAHKWMCSGKGCSFLYVNKEWHTAIKPAVVSHGYSSTTLAAKFTWVGLQDYCHYLGLNTAFDCWERIGVENIRTYITIMIQNIGKYLTKAWNTDLLATTEMFGPMICVRLPGPRVPRNGDEHTDIQDLLYFDHKIEAPIKMLQNRLYVRVSCHIYNDWNDYIRLADVMKQIRPPLWGDDDLNDISAAEEAEPINPNSGCG